MKLTLISSRLSIIEKIISIIAGCFTIVASCVGVIGFGYRLDKGSTDEQKETISNVIDKASDLSSDQRYKKATRTFNEQFDKIYEYQDTVFERLAWLGILITYWVFAFLRISIEIFHPGSVDVPVLLGMTIGISGLTIVSIAGVFGNAYVRDRLSHISNEVPETSNDFVNMFGWGLIGAIIFSLLTIGLFLSYQNNRILFWFLSILAFPIMILEYSLLVGQQYGSPPNEANGNPPINAERSPLRRNQGVFLLLCAIIIYISVIIVFTFLESSSIKLAGVLGTVALSIPLGSFLLFRSPNKIDYLNAEPNINPYTAMLSSIFFIVIVGGISEIFFDGATSYLRDLQNTGLIMLSFLAFNIFADTISIQETNWVLKKTEEASIFDLIFLLIFDIVISGIIYILLPWFVGQDMSVFLDGLLFSGPSPWIGILFYSTFGTSIIFYVFMLVSFTILILNIKTQINRLSPDFTEEYPFVFISSILLVMVFGVVLISVITVVLLDL